MRTRGLRWLRRTGIALLTVSSSCFAASALYLAWDDVAPVRLAVPVPGGTVTAAGVPTHVEHWPAARPSGLPPLVLVPGFAESTYVFSRVAPLLAADRDVYAYDVRGYGTTAHVPPYTLAADTDQLVGLIGALGLTRPIVVGHSLGAAIALSVALRDPGAVPASSRPTATAPPTSAPTGPRRAAAGARRRLLTLPPLGPAVVTAIVRHRDPIRRLVASQCGPGCPVDDAAIDRWRAPFLTTGGVTALLAVAGQPLIGLTDDRSGASGCRPRSSRAATTRASTTTTRSPRPPGCTPRRWPSSPARATSPCSASPTGSRPRWSPCWVASTTHRRNRYRRYLVHRRKDTHMLGDIAGIGPVKDALMTTNALLEKVLEELQRTNQRQLEAVVTELVAVRESVDRLVAGQESQAAAAA